MSRSTPSSSKIKAFLGGLALFVLSGCLEPATKTSAGGRLPLPTKDEILLVNGHPLSLTDYFDIRRRVGPTPNREAVVWMGEASLLLQEEWSEKGKHLEPAASVVLAGYAQGIFPSERARPFFEGHFPSARELFFEIEARRNRAAVQQNQSLIAELR